MDSKSLFGPQALYSTISRLFGEYVVERPRPPYRIAAREAAASQGGNDVIRPAPLLSSGTHVTAPDLDDLNRPAALDGAGPFANCHIHGNGIA